MRSAKSAGTTSADGGRISGAGDAASNSFHPFPALGELGGDERRLSSSHGEKGFSEERAGSIRHGEQAAHAPGTYA